MFFYLLYNSTLIQKELDNKTKFIKIFLYGGISYIILHATLFIGGKDAILHSFKSYFWLFFILDCITISVTLNINYNIDLKDLFKFLKINSDTGNLNNQTNQDNNQVNNQNNIKSILKNKNNKNNKNNNKNNKNNPVLYKKKVSFHNEFESDSDSDSEIGTDVDIDAFKESLDFN